MPLSILLPKEMEEQIRELAEERMTSMTSLIRLSIKQFLEKNEKTKSKRE